MKKILLLVILTIAVLGASAQTFKAPTKSKSNSSDTTTTYKYEIKDSTYTVYKSPRGAFYIWKWSKRSNHYYKMYLPKETQQAMGRKYPAKKD